MDGKAFVERIWNTELLKHEAVIHPAKKKKISWNRFPVKCFIYTDNPVINYSCMLKHL